LPYVTNVVQRSTLREMQSEISRKKCLQIVVDLTKFIVHNIIYA